jgi:hypothetical protein
VSSGVHGMRGGDRRGADAALSGKQKYAHRISPRSASSAL